LLLNLRLSGRDGGSGVGVGEATALLAVLERCSLGGADSLAGAIVGAAGGTTVGVANAPARDELLAVAGSDVLGTGVVGGDGCEGSEGDYGRKNEG